MNRKFNVPTNLFAQHSVDKRTLLKYFGILLTFVGATVTSKYTDLELEELVNKKLNEQNKEK